MRKKQRVFVDEYLQCWNATEAAKRAGYSERTAYSIGSRLLNNVEVSEAIQQRLDDLTMSTDEILVRTTELARGAIGEYMTATGLDMIRLVNDGKAYLLKKYTRDFNKVTVEFYDMQKALETMGKARGVFKDAPDLVVNISDFKERLEQVYGEDGEQAEIHNDGD